MLYGLFGATVQAQEIKPFKPGDRVVFLGNSITDGGHYHSYIWLYYLTRFPRMDVTFLNAGIGGDRVIEMLRRLDGDVFGKRPTVLVTTFGMNDSGYFEYNGDEPEKFADEKVLECETAYRTLEARLRQLPDTRIVLLGSSPYDETAIIDGNTPFKGKNRAMQRIVDFQRQSARDNGWEFFDFNAPMTEINQRLQQERPSFTICGNDRIHPDNDWHMVMAYLFLKAQGFTGHPVAEVHIDAGKQQIVRTAQCDVTGLTRTPDGLKFRYLAHALPYPLDTIARGWGAKQSQAAAAKIVPFVEEMNQEILKISGLKGDYQLLIDQEAIDTFTAAQLEQGINLAAISHTPQYQQALKVMFLNEERWEIERRFRDLAWVQYNFFQPRGLLNADNRKALEVLDQHIGSDGWLRGRRDLYAKAMHPEVRQAWEEEQAVLLRRMREISVPVPREFTLVRVK